MLKKDAREPYKEIGVAQCFQGLRRFCFQTRDFSYDFLWHYIKFLTCSSLSISFSCILCRWVNIGHLSLEVNNY